jgi:hypothetical protein
VDTDPAKFLDLAAPNDSAIQLKVPSPTSHDNVVLWAFEHITEPQFAEVKQRVTADAAERRTFLNQAFHNLVMDFNFEINDL